MRSKGGFVTGFHLAPAATVIALFLCLLAGFPLLFTGGLSFFHIYLSCSAQTTREFWSVDPKPPKNPFSKGCCYNFCYVYCPPLYARPINWRKPANVVMTGNDV